MSSFLFSSLFNLSHTRPRRTMDSIRVSEAPDTGSIPVEATLKYDFLLLIKVILPHMCF